MKILHVVPSISRNTGGPSRSVQGLVAGLNMVGVEAWLMTLHNGEEPWVEGVTHYVNGEPFENVVARIKPSIVHMHGLWSLTLHWCAVICRRWRIPYVIAPRGMLEPWSLQQKRLKKRIARFLYQDRDLKFAAALHATAESEAEQFRKLGFRNPIIVSPNGVNVPKRFSRVGHVERVGRRVLFVSRMHPKKGVLELVEAFKKVVSGGVEKWRSGEVRGCGSEGVKEWKVELVYTVSGELEREYEAKVKARVKELGLEDRFIFTGALNDDEKWKAYARADLFVLPTYSENFGIVVAEALWAGVPVITTKGTPWSELEGNTITHPLSNSSTSKCGKWIDLPTEGSNPTDWPALVSTLESMMSMPDDERRQMGENGRRLVEEKYTWDAVVRAMIEGYRNILK